MYTHMTFTLFIWAKVHFFQHQGKNPAEGLLRDVKGIQRFSFPKLRESLKGEKTVQEAEVYIVIGTLETSQGFAKGQILSIVCAVWLDYVRNCNLQFKQTNKQTCFDWGVSTQQEWASYSLSFSKNCLLEAQGLSLSCCESIFLKAILI